MAERPVSPLVALERRAGVALVTLQGGRMNALSRALLAELEQVASRLASDPPGAAVVWGGERIFAAGADISELAGPEAAREVSTAFHAAMDAVAAIPRATIAAISGYALGGGCELALACDLRVASDNARLGQPEVQLGIIPGGGGTQRLARLVGPARAKEIVFSGRQVPADEALRIGLVDRVCPRDGVLSDALAWAGELAAGAVVAQGLAKQAIDGGLSAGLGDGLGLERRLFERVFRSEDAATGVRSFMEKGPGKARFVGR